MSFLWPSVFYCTVQLKLHCLSFKRTKVTNDKDPSTPFHLLYTIVWGREEREDNSSWCVGTATKLNVNTFAPQGVCLLGHYAFIRGASHLGASRQCDATCISNREINKNQQKKGTSLWGGVPGRSSATKTRGLIGLVSRKAQEKMANPVDLVLASNYKGRLRGTLTRTHTYPRGK